MFDEFVHVNNVFLSPDVAGFIVHGQDAAEAFSVAPAQQVKSAHKTISIITILIPTYVISHLFVEKVFKRKRDGKPEFRAISALYELVVTTPLSQLVEL